MPPRAFFAYPAQPATSEMISKAVHELNTGGVVTCQTWEDLRVGGKLIIGEICRAINDADLFCADVTHLNQNVMFELGYAIAENKRIWLIHDPTFAESHAQFNKLKLLTTVGYARCTNSVEIVNHFYSDHPYDDLDATVFDQTIRPQLSTTAGDLLLYLKSLHNTEASRILSNKIDKAAEAAGLPLIIDDPRETTAQPLGWYGEKVFNAVGVVCHLLSPQREGALLHNARYALVAGLAHGMKKKLLMLAHGDYTVPIDYRDLLKQYQTGSEAEKHFEEWIVPILHTLSQRGLAEENFIASVQLAQELGHLRIGEPIAENESERLRDEYFVETAAYLDAFHGRHTIFVGRKGAGKSANFIKLSATLISDKRNLVCEIKPIAYEFQGIVSLLGKYKSIDIKGYAIESLWKFLIYSEMALAACRAIRNRPSGFVERNERDLLALMEQNDGLLEQEFSVRLERCVELLQLEAAAEGDIETRRKGISEALHSGFLHDLRAALSGALEGRNRVAILVDNLDKAWDKQSDVDSLSEFLLGLLKASLRISNDFRSVAATQKTVNVSLAVFIRADIFQRVLKIAREPDKIPSTKIIWNDDELLLRLIEERFVSSIHDSEASPQRVWDRYFESTVMGMPVQRYLLSRVLRRPRDLLFFVRAAIATAVNRKHAKITADDILTSERQYSAFAIESVLVENGISIAALEELLYEFAGCKAVLTEGELISVLQRSHIPEDKNGSVINHLCSLTFFGQEVQDEVFRFAEDQQESLKNAVLARKLAEKNGTAPRYRINPAFCTFLEIDESRYFSREIS